MIGYILLCYVDTDAVSHNQKTTNEIMSLINRSDIFSFDIAALFKIESHELLLSDFIESVTEFLNDPIGILYEDDWDDESDEDEENYEKMSEVEKILWANQFSDENKADFFPYEDDYTPLFIQFVSSRNLFEKFINASKDFDIENLDEFHFISYSISSLDQMEIFRRIQNPQTFEDRIEEMIASRGEKKRALLEKINKKNRN